MIYRAPSQHSSLLPSFTPSSPRFPLAHPPPGIPLQTDSSRPVDGMSHGNGEVATGKCLSFFAVIPRADTRIRSVCRPVECIHDIID